MGILGDYSINSNFYIYSGLFSFIANLAIGFFVFLKNPKRIYEIDESKL